MRHFVLISFLFLTFGPVFGQPQASRVILDTLLIEQFAADPSANMPLFPSGNDTTWVNYDADGLAPQCVDGDDTPGGWYFESDLGEDPAQTPNYCYTSCSLHDVVDIEGHRAANWLILPPINITDTTARLQWKSLSVSGPAFLDGYKVVVSTTNNNTDEGSFSDTIFRAAEMIRSNNGQYVSLALNNYQFSTGYIQANNYTLTDYYFLVPGGGGAPPFYHGRLEPHDVPLAQYIGKKIYIAFVHDSDNDFLLQLDDILVVLNDVSNTNEPTSLRQFSIAPNPADAHTRITYAFDDEQAGLLRIYDALGRIYVEIPFASGAQNSFDIDVHNFAAGLYTATLTTTEGIASRRLVVR
jgi:Secretion system C-terminal sorting domain